MRKLELRIPPVLVAILIGCAMWGVNLMTSEARIDFTSRLLVAVVIAVLGLVVALAGVAEFRRARTTVDPTNPAKSSSVVTCGIYRYTRNPMYVGFLLVVIAWAVYLSNLWAFIGPVAFVLYMNRFQIGPEERVLAARFGAPFEAYLRSVRRWI